MKQTDRAEKHLDLLLQRYPILTVQKEEIRKAYQVMAATYEAGGKLLIAGNGGSAADAEHIVGELMKRFKKPRKLDAALAERLLQESPELGPELVQNLQKALPAIALDGHLALSTAYANDCAADSPLIPLCDVCIRAPLLETYQIQELHLPIYHCLCLMLEEHFFCE